MVQQAESSSARILLVDAHVQGRALYRIALESAGYAVTEVSNGLEAIHLAHLTRPDAILIELTLPFMDGLETAEQLKRDRGTAAIPVIVLTTAGVPMSRFGALSRWCDGYLRKPCEPARLLDLIRQRTSRRTPSSPGSSWCGPQPSPSDGMSLLATHGETVRSRWFA